MAEKEFKDYVLSRIPLGHVGQTEDVADAVLFLASDMSKMVTGSTIKVDGGWTAI
jgi:2-deoxy-D-gluconate 3-dehydrogenase